MYQPCKTLRDARTMFFVIPLQSISNALALTVKIAPMQFICLTY